MTIRDATEQDISSIVELLRISLGESLMPKSEVFWRWKHIDNPFGKSPVLLAFENEQLIGVRAFMRWEWSQGDMIYKSVRAVDTATHPNHQGKGIFTKLTLHMVNECKRDGVDFIFNTPNKSSKPGYLKMGWKTLGRLRLKIRPVLLISTHPRDFHELYAINKELIHFFLNVKTRTGHGNIQTSCTSAYVLWRYLYNPNVKYYFLTDEVDEITYLIIFRLRKGRLGTEFRICDVFTRETANGAKVMKQIIRAAADCGAKWVTCCDADDLLMTRWLEWPAGPAVTSYLLSGKLNSLSFDNWRPSLGDLEVF